MCISPLHFFFKFWQLNPGPCMSETSVLTTKLPPNTYKILLKEKLYILYLILNNFPSFHFVLGPASYIASHSLNQGHCVPPMGPSPSALSLGQLLPLCHLTFQVNYSTTTHQFCLTVLTLNVWKKESNWLRSDYWPSVRYTMWLPTIGTHGYVTLGQCVPVATWYTWLSRPTFAGTQVEGNSKRVGTGWVYAPQ
jgi:hypothetical protein